MLLLSGTIDLSYALFMSLYMLSTEGSDNAVLTVTSNTKQASEMSKENPRDQRIANQTRKPWVPSKTNFHKYLLCRSYEVEASHTHGNGTVTICSESQYDQTLFFS